MNKDKIIKISNIVGITSTILLVYWTFTYLSVIIFGLRIFGGNVKEIFDSSIVGIFALMFGALFVNIMFNLTKISEHINKLEKVEKKRRKSITSILIILSFPLIFGLLFIGNTVNSIKMEKTLRLSAKYMIEEKHDRIQKLSDYTFTSEYIKKAEKILSYLSRIDNSINFVSIIVYDEIDGSPTYLRIQRLLIGRDTKSPRDKIWYIYRGSNNDREYLKSVFVNGNDKPRFKSSKESFELLHPVGTKGKRIVMRFSSCRTIDCP